jgi:Kef-type K+ transport system membrane component KefB
MTNLDLSVLFFLQVAVILATCRLMGALARRLGQPVAVGEMVAGVVLGPSLFGAVAPVWHAALFPPQSMTIIFAVAQVGIALYMFLVGVEFRTDLLRDRAPSAVAVSVAGMAVPFLLGGVIALAVYADGMMFRPTVTPAQAFLYLGAAMSITAFPMLARIVQERGLAGTPLGTLALAAGSMDDAAAWCVLAVLLATLGGAPMIAVAAIGGGVLYTLVVLLALRSALRPLGRQVEQRGAMSHQMLGFVLTLAMLGSWFTDWIGIYAVFGAFVLGTAMPRGRFADEVQRLLAPLTVGLLLPLFFAFRSLPNYFAIAPWIAFYAATQVYRLDGVKRAGPAWVRWLTDRFDALAGLVTPRVQPATLLLPAEGERRRDQEDHRPEGERQEAAHRYALRRERAADSGAAAHRRHAHLVLARPMQDGCDLLAPRWACNQDARRYAAAPDDDVEGRAGRIDLASPFHAIAELLVSPAIRSSDV